MSNEETSRPDDEDIPLLRDVVEPNKIEPSIGSQAVENHQTAGAEPDFIAIRQELAHKLYQELSPMISAAMTSAVDSATNEIRRVMLDEARGVLDNRIHDLIEEVLSRRFER